MRWPSCVGSRSTRSGSGPPWRISVSGRVRPAGRSAWQRARRGRPAGPARPARPDRVHRTRRGGERGHGHRHRSVTACTSTAHRSTPSRAGRWATRGPSPPTPERRPVIDTDLRPAGPAPSRASRSSTGHRRWAGGHRGDRHRAPRGRSAGTTPRRTSCTGPCARSLGDHVRQQGSLVAPDRLRFDFAHFAPVTRDEIRAIEDLANAEILDQRTGAPLRDDHGRGREARGDRVLRRQVRRRRARARGRRAQHRAVRRHPRAGTGRHRADEGRLRGIDRVEHPPDRGGDGNGPIERLATRGGPAGVPRPTGSGFPPTNCSKASTSASPRSGA